MAKFLKGKKESAPVEEQAAKEAEDIQAQLDRDEEDELEQKAREKATVTKTPEKKIVRDKTLVVIEYTGEDRPPFPVMFGERLTWFGKDAEDGLTEWQGAVEKWYADILMAKEPGAWKVVEMSVPKKRNVPVQKKEFPAKAWMSVRTLEDVEKFKKKCGKSTPPSAFGHLRKLLGQYSLSPSQEIADAIDAIVNVHPPDKEEAEDLPREEKPRIRLVKEGEEEIDPDEVQFK